MGLFEAVAVSSIIAGTFYLMNRERVLASAANAAAGAQGPGAAPDAMKRLKSSSISLFVMVAAVMLLTSFFISGGEGSRRSSGGGAAGSCCHTGGGGGGTPIDVALRQISTDEPYW